MANATTTQSPHHLEILADRDYNGDVVGTCGTCFDPDWDGEQYVTGGQYNSRTEQDVRDLFHDDHLNVSPELVFGA